MYLSPLTIDFTRNRTAVRLIPMKAHTDKDKSVWLRYLAAGGTSRTAI